MKECRTCKQTKDANDFYRFHLDCKPCALAAKKIYRSAHKERDRQTKRRYYQAHKEKLCSGVRALYRRDRDRIIKRQVLWNRKARSDPRRRLINHIGRRLTEILNGMKSQSWRQLVGYEARLLVPHLEAQFEPWMNWANYGTEWHVDHMRPISSFKFPEEIAQCWALSNLRPLRALDNLRKGASLELWQKESPPAEAGGQEESPNGTVNYREIRLDRAIVEVALNAFERTNLRRAFW
jgi:hypothetical protein